MSFDEIFDLTAGVYFNFYNIYRLQAGHRSILRTNFAFICFLRIFLGLQHLVVTTDSKFSTGSSATKRKTATTITAVDTSASCSFSHATENDEIFIQRELKDVLNQVMFFFTLGTDDSG